MRAIRDRLSDEYPRFLRREGALARRDPSQPPTNDAAVQWMPPPEYPRAERDVFDPWDFLMRLKFGLGQRRGI